MKYTLPTGEVIEGTAEEITQMIKLLKNDNKNPAVAPARTVEPAPKKFTEPAASVTPDLKFKGYGWTPAQEKFVYDNLKAGTMPSPKKLHKILGKNVVTILAKIRNVADANKLPRPDYNAKPEKVSAVQTGSKHWSDAEDAILKKEYDKDLSVPIDFTLLETRLPGRNRKQILGRATYLKIASQKRARQVKQPFAKRAPSNYNVFMAQKIKELVRGGMKQQDAFVRATNCWDAFKGERKVHVTEEPAVKKEAYVPEEFPKFALLNSGFETILEGIARNVIANNGKITLPNAGYSLGINDGNHWRDFVAEFMSKTPAIAAFFGVGNKFKQEVENGKYHVISYKN